MNLLLHDFNLQSTALLDEDLSDDVSCVRRIYLETAQLSGLSIEEISQYDIHLYTNTHILHIAQNTLKHKFYTLDFYIKTQRFASILVVITFSKIDPERVRASTSSSRLTCDYFKTP